MYAAGLDRRTASPFFQQAATQQTARRGPPAQRRSKAPRQESRRSFSRIVLGGGDQRPHSNSESRSGIEKLDKKNAKQRASFANLLRSLIYRLRPIDFPL